MLGIGVRLPREKQEENVYRLAQATADYVGMKQPIPARGGWWRIAITTSAPATASRPRAWARRSVCWHRRRGFSSIPFTSGKAMAGMIDLIRKGQLAKGETVVFLHTGGAVGLFGYNAFLESAG